MPRTRPVINGYHARLTKRAQQVGFNDERDTRKCRRARKRLGKKRKRENILDNVLFG